MQLVMYMHVQFSAYEHTYPGFKFKLTKGVLQTLLVLFLTDGVFGLEGWLKLKLISRCLCMSGVLYKPCVEGFLKILGVEELVKGLTG